MKKFRHITIGGIQQKIFNLVLITIVLLIAAYTAVILYQSKRLTNLVSTTNDSQKESINDISEATMRGVLDINLVQSTQLEAYIAEDIFDDAVRVVNIVADYTTKLFESPSDYPARDVELPDKTKDGQISIQVLTEEGIDINDPAIANKLGLIGNLSELMSAVYKDSNVDSCYCALPDGVMLLVDDHSGTKFDENGNIVNIPIRQRLWYSGAQEAGKLYFTDVTSDLFTGEISIMCSLPIYVNDELVAIIGADLFLNDVSSAIDATERDGSFVCIVNQHGHVLFSPQKEGIFKVIVGEDAIDLRNSDNEELANFINDSMDTQTNLRTIELDGEKYYVAGAPIKKVGWAILSVVPKALADQPANAMIGQLDAIQENAIKSFNEGMSKARLTIFVMITIVLIIGSSISLFLSKRIVKPLELITLKVQSLGGDNLQFEMEDSFRTKDEIEVLAEAFAMLSKKTVEYIKEIERVTGEKERIGAELTLATRIQADMLPNIYPAFPERKEFDIYASMCPAKEVGGDFYDFFLVDDDHLCLFIADVSGKGVPAALFMMASMIILANNASMGKTPAQILRDTNEAICSNNREEMFVTVWLGILEISTGKLVAANAGHEYPIIKKPNGDFEYLRDKHGFVIGGMSGLKYQEYEVMLEPGSKLFVYTDGVPEATNDRDELFGEERLLNALNNNPDLNVREMLNQVKNEVDKFANGRDQFDDITMLGLDYLGKNDGIIEKTFQANDKLLADVTDFITNILEKNDASMAVLNQMTLAIEEIFVNIAHYAYPDGVGEAVIRVNVQDDVCTIDFIDSGIAFNPLEKEAPDITESAENRQIGGLGIFLVKKLMDEVNYEYVNNKNILSIRKKIK